MADLVPETETETPVPEDARRGDLAQIQAHADRQLAFIGEVDRDFDPDKLERFSSELPATLDPARRAELVAQVEALEPWLQGPFMLAEDLVIAGRWRNDQRWAMLDETIPELVGDLSGRTVLDVGSNAGYDPFMFARRGASYVLACEPWAFYEQACFLEAHYRTGVTLRRIGWQELHPEQHGRYDFVHCHGVLYHEPHPLALLQKLRAMLVDGGDLLLGSMMLAAPEESAHARFVPDAYAQDPSWWWVPGRLALRWMLEAAGFALVRELGTHEGPRGEFPVVSGYLHVRATESVPGLGVEGPNPPAVRFPAGHHYSPMYDNREVTADRERLYPATPRGMVGVDWNEEAQLRFCSDDLRGADALKLAVEATPDTAEYHADNPQFPALDAWVLAAMLRRLHPARMVEIGSGFSTLIAARTNREQLGGELHLTCIEPFPHTFLQGGVDGVTELRVERVQDSPPELFEALGDGDVLFVDTSHTVKTGGDVVWIFEEILPRLAPGVHVHIHDVFLPEDYPEEWVAEGWGWNENYLVRAFLSFNSAFEVLWGSHYMCRRHRKELLAALPGLEAHLERGGSSLWIRRSA